MSAHTRIKICGIRERAGLDATIDGGADFVGFVHHARSPRHVTISQAEELAAHLPESISPVGLFVNEAAEVILSCPFQWIQLHGDEDESLCQTLAKAGRKIIRGVHFSAENVRRWQACDAIEHLLVDGSETGGTGQAFDHESLIAHLPSKSRPYLLAGGLDPDNVGAAVHGTRAWGVDVSSGVELIRGRKDPERILDFCAAVRAADAQSE